MAEGIRLCCIRLPAKKQVSDTKINKKSKPSTRRLRTPPVIKNLCGNIHTKKERSVSTEPDITSNRDEKQLDTRSTRVRRVPMVFTWSDEDIQKFNNRATRLNRNEHTH